MRTLITNGTIVAADGSSIADVLIDGETIAQIGPDLAGSGVSADETIDAIRTRRAAAADVRLIKPTSTHCLSARQRNPGRGSSYRHGKSVQTIVPHTH